MVLVPVWHDSLNTVNVKDKNFDAATDMFLLKFEHKQNCSRFNIPVDSVTSCKGVVSFMFNMNCSIPPGEYELTIENLTTSENYECLSVKIYKNVKTCYNCN